MENSIAKVESEYASKLKSVEGELNSIINDRQEQIDKLVGDINAQQEEFGNAARMTDVRHSEDIARLKDTHDQILKDKSKYIAQLEEDKDDLVQELQEQERRLLRAQEDALQDLRDVFAEQELELRQEIRTLESDNRQLTLASTEENRQVTEDYDQEVALVEARYRKTISELEEKSCLLRNQLLHYEKKFQVFTDELSSKDSEVNRRDSEIAIMSKTNSDLQRRLAMLEARD
ncbi:hypothetical protein GEMRC1_007033 [Eukaryota sp. GEM-RC1]